MAKHRYNEIKYRILYLLSETLDDLSPQEIADAVGITRQNVKEQMHRLVDMEYVWRKTETRKGKRNYFAYCNLKPKGKRVLKRLKERVALQEQTGRDISLNLKKSVYHLNLNIEKEKSRSMIIL